MKELKKIWFLFILVLLCIPMFQNFIGWFKEKPLNGAFIPAEKPMFSINAIWNETYQDSAIAYIEENIGFHNFLVRLNNQLIFSIFNESPIKGPVVGKNGMLYEESYIISYNGTTFIGNEKIQEISFNLKTAQAILKEKGKTLLIVHTPGKASFFPEYIPYRYNIDRHNRTNYEAYIEYLTQDKVNFIDLNRYICDMKDTVSNALYCNLSAHWTLYAAALSIDTILNYLDHYTNKDLIDFKISGFESPDTLRNQDDDLYRTMNIMFLPKHNKINYPIIEINSDANKYRPKLLAIADSYWWTVYAPNVHLAQDLFPEGAFWFYNKTIYPVRNPLQNVNDIDYYNDVNKYEIVLLVTTEATNHLFPYDFCSKYIIGYEKEFLLKNDETQHTTADSLYTIYREKSINNIIQEINNNEDWKNKIIQQAKDQNTNLDTMIYRNAEYAYKQKAGIIN